VDPRSSRKTVIFTLVSRTHQCKHCGRQFVVDATPRVRDEEQRALVERLLCEQISLRGICRTIGVSIRWLMDFMVAYFAAVPAPLHVQPVAASRAILLGCLEVEADELWSFVQKKTNSYWLWLAMDQQTRQIIAFHVGDRSRDSAKQLWAKIPALGSVLKQLIKCRIASSGNLVNQEEPWRLSRYSVLRAGAGQS